MSIFNLSTYSPSEKFPSFISLNNFIFLTTSRAPLLQISKKILAAVGQPILISSYKRKFDIFNVDMAQILLTEDDFDIQTL